MEQHGQSDAPRVHDGDIAPYFSQTCPAIIIPNIFFLLRKLCVYTKEAVMQERAIFSAKEWIAASLISAERLKPEALQAVESFTLMWNVFEGLVCDNSATILRLEKLSAEIVSRRRCKPQLERIFTYFKNRYYNRTGFTAHFEGLLLRSADRKEFIKAVLQGKTPDYPSKVFAVLIILYKMRSNLFHGIKSLDMLNSQAVNLFAACRALAIIIEAHGRHFKRERYTEELHG
jgi:hypothetical protein